MGAGRIFGGVSRKTLAVAAAYTAGAAAQAFFGACAWPAALSLLATAAGAAYMAWNEKNGSDLAAAAGNAAAVLFVAIIFQAGFLRSAVLYSARCGHEKNVAAMEGKTCKFSGTVDGVRRGREPGTLSIRVRIEKIRNAKTGACSDFGADAFVTARPVKSKAAPPVRAGDRIEFLGEPSAMGELRNPGVRHADNPLKAAPITVRVKPGNLEIVSRGGTVFSGPAFFREAAGRLFERYFPDEIEGFLKAFFCGDASAAGDEILLAFREAGTLHALVISGGHITVFIYFISALASAAGLKKRGWIVVFVSVTVYVFSAGLQAASCRAYISYLIIFGAKISGREIDRFQALLSAYAIQTMLFTEFIFDAGFWLSYIATFMLFASEKAGETSIVAGNIRAAVFAAAGSYPIVCYISGYYPAVSFLANVATLWIYEILLCAILVFLASAVLAPFLAPPAAASVYFLSIVSIRANEFFAAFPKFNLAPYGVGFAETAALSVIVMAAAAAFAENGLTAFEGFSRKNFNVVSASALAAVTAIALHSAASYYSRGFEITFLDVGQGDCAVARSEHGKYIVVDAGGSNDRIYEKVILPFLRSSRVETIDYLIITHGHGDHYCAAQKLIEKSGIKIGNFVCSSDISAETEYNRLTAAVRRLGINRLKPAAEDIITVDGIELKFYWPDPKAGYVKTSENDRSLAFALKFMNRSFLFAGDISSDVEKYIMRHYEIGETFCLKSPHHGSKTSNSRVFAAAANPEFVFISSGKNNRYNHPHPEAVQNFISQKSKIIDSQTGGGVTFKFTKKNVVLENYRGRMTTL